MSIKFGIKNRDTKRRNKNRQIRMLYQDEERSISRERLNRSVDGKKIENLYNQHKKKQYRMEELKKEIDKVIQT